MTAATALNHDGGTLAGAAVNAEAVARGLDKLDHRHQFSGC
ncbi:hypothetical protein [Arthrobacter sp. HY1533]|nr:hypothetical protein [Arthrobacter sp. HY1533]